MENIKILDSTNKEKAEVSSSSLDTVKDLVEVVGKIVIGLFAIFYAIGLVVVNLHLNNFGVYSLSLFRLSYVTAGIWTLIPVIFLILVLAFFISIPFLFSQNARNSINAYFGLTRQAEKEPVFDNVFVVVVLFSVLTFLFYGLYSINFTGKNFPLTFLTSLLIVTYLAMWLHLAVKSSHIATRFARGFIMFLMCIFIFASHIFSFGTGVYQDIPSYLGGGSPQKAQLILNEESKLNEKLADLGVLFKSSNLTANVQILLATEEEYILLIESVDSEGQIIHKGLTLPKDMIQAVLYEAASGGGR